MQGISMVSPRVAAIAVLFLSPAFAGSVPSMCGAEETTYFTCVASGKVVSLCASSDLTSTTGTLTYRIGRQGQPPELEYPKPPKHPSLVFHSYSDSFSKGGTEALSFSIGAYQYSIYATRSVYGYNGSGVFVRKNGKQISFLECNNIAREDKPFYTSIRKLGIPSGEAGYVGPESSN